MGDIKRYNFTDKFDRERPKKNSLVYMFNRRGDINMDRCYKPKIEEVPIT